MFTHSKLIAFLATSDPSRAKAFYGGVLQLRLISEDNFALVYDCAGTMLRIAMVREVIAVPYTVLGWEAQDIAATVRGLTAKGVRLERFPGLQQDELGIWSAPSGARVAWFKDPDGNLLSVSQH